MRKYFELGGLVAALVLIGFGVAAIVVSVDGGNEVRSALRQQHVVGTPDMTPSAIAAEARKAGLNPATLELPTCTAAGKDVKTGTTARCFATYMRIHALEATGGKTYSEMPRYATASGAGTNEAATALKDPKGQPVENPARNVWVTETALSTALNASYMGEQLSLFGIMVGIALLLAGVGFGVLTFAGALRNPQTALGFMRRFQAGHHGQAATSH